MLGGRKVGNDSSFSLSVRMSTRNLLMEGYSSMRMYSLKRKHFSNKDPTIVHGIVNDKGISTTSFATEGLPETVETIMLECGDNTSSVMLLSDIYSFKNDMTFDGLTFILGDFLVTICIIKSRNGVPKGITVEAEYTPCPSISRTKVLLDEFKNLLGKGHCVDMLDFWKFTKAASELPDNCTARHVALQYIAAFNVMR